MDNSGKSSINGGDFKVGDKVKAIALGREGYGKPGIIIAIGTIPFTQPYYVSGEGFSGWFWGTELEANINGFPPGFNSSSLSSSQLADVEDVEDGVESGDSLRACITEVFSANSQGTPPKSSHLGGGEKELSGVTGDAGGQKSADVSDGSEGCISNIASAREDCQVNAELEAAFKLPDTDRVNIGWLTGTLDSREIVDILRLLNKTFEIKLKLHEKGWNGYDFSYRDSKYNIVIGIAPRPQEKLPQIILGEGDVRWYENTGHLTINIPQTAFEAIGPKKVGEFLIQVWVRETKLTRLDVYFDDFERVISPGEIYEGVINEEILVPYFRKYMVYKGLTKTDKAVFFADGCTLKEAKHKAIEFRDSLGRGVVSASKRQRDSDSKSESCWIVTTTDADNDGLRIGSPKSEKLIRVYDKFLESGGIETEDCIRYEVQYRNGYAIDAFKSLMEKVDEYSQGVNDAVNWDTMLAYCLKGVIKGAVQFKVMPSTKILPRVQTYLPAPTWWTYLMDEVLPVKVNITAIIKTFHKAKSWYEKYVVPTVSLISDAFTTHNGDFAAYQKQCVTAGQHRQSDLHKAMLQAVTSCPKGYMGKEVTV